MLDPDESRSVPPVVILAVVLAGLVVELRRCLVEFPGVGGVVFLLVVGHLVALGLMWSVGRVAAARDFLARVREDRRKLAKAEHLLVAADVEVASLRGLLSGAIESGRVEVREALGKEIEAARSENRALLAALEARSRERDEFRKAAAGVDQQHCLSSTCDKCGQVYFSSPPFHVCPAR